MKNKIERGRKGIKILLLILCGGFSFASFCQLSLEQINHLKIKLIHANQDSIKFDLYNSLANGYRFSNIDSSLFYSDQAILFSEKMHNQARKADLLSLKGATVLEAGKLPESLQFQYEALKIGEKIKDSSVIAFALNRIGNIYMELADYEKAKQYYFYSKELFEKIKDTGMFHNEVSNIGNIYFLMQKPDSALYYQQIVYEASLKTNDRGQYTRPEIMYRMGNVYKLKGDKVEALKYYKKAIIEADIDNDVRGLSMSNLFIAELFKQMNYPDSSLIYAYRSIQLGEMVSFRKGVYDAAILISEIFNSTHKSDSAFKYLARAIVEKDSLTGAKRFQQLQRIVLDEQEHRREADSKIVADENNKKQNILLASLAVFLIIATILYRNNQLKQKTNKILEITLNNLQATQTDLKVKNRELEIETALEKVRTRTMAMQRSEELVETCVLLFDEFHKLRVVNSGPIGILDRVFIGIFKENERLFELSITGLDGKSLDHTYILSLDEPTNMIKTYTGWKAGHSLEVIDLQGEELNQWLDYLKTVGLPINPNLDNKRRVNSSAFFSKGAIGITSNMPLPEETLQLLQRFAETFNLTYTRFQDLKDAEARTQIAIKDASLDRVRAEIASMRTSEDLQHITPLIWRELTALGVPFFRCGVFIVDDAKQMIHFYLSAPDGKPLAALELAFDGAEITKNATAFWREQKVYISHWSKEDFLQFAQNLIAEGQIQNVHTYQGGDEAPESLTLQFIPFAQGMMYVGSADNLSATQIELVQSLADSFSTAYARYEDFNKLEAAKHQIELALTNLRATQTQLIQSEKMASLGELTAGIAHEIQNPLNFVNNFSEVNAELIDELQQELKAGKIDDAIEISIGIKANEEKINHHGKRADAIVKGMLQHSQSSNGTKEHSDINALADEYLRLAYHGLRAKDKSFNTTMVTEFDKTIGKVNIIPQDIGRVILNLISNAFYAVDEKKKQMGEGYEPTVTISTKKIINPSGRAKVMISVADNGNGIPQKIVDKIFQPFFTTKPTGQGTGLGLSLSYDIVKAHGGELKVETREGNGSEFVIILPVNI